MPTAQRELQLQSRKFARDVLTKATACETLPTPEERPDTPSQWVIYFQVADTDATVARTPRLKGSVVVPGTDQPGVGRWAVLRDPLGVMFGVLQR